MTGSSTFTGNQNNNPSESQFKKEAFDLSAIKVPKDGKYLFKHIQARISKMEGAGGCCDHEHEDHGEHVHANLPLPILKRVCALEHLQEKRAQLEAQFRGELMQLERKYLGLYEPLYQERTKIVLGEREPTTEELANLTTGGVEELEGQSKGIPNFWLTALKNHPTLAGLITEADEAALRALCDIRVCGLSETGTPGFRLEFRFGLNDYFTNAVLSKEYILENQVSVECDDLVYDHAVGTEIDWKAGKNLCFRTVTKVQRHRSNKTTRTVTRREPTESFFNFFYPPQVPSNHDDDEDAEDAEDNIDPDELDAQIQMDYELGDLIKSRIVPLAVDWYTGKALAYADYMEDYEEDGEFDDDEDEDEDDYSD